MMFNKSSVIQEEVLMCFTGGNKYDESVEGWNIQLSSPNIYFLFLFSFFILFQEFINL